MIRLTNVETGENMICRNLKEVQQYLTIKFEKEVHLPQFYLKLENGEPYKGVWYLRKVGDLKKQYKKSKDSYMFKNIKTGEVIQGDKHYIAEKLHCSWSSVNKRISPKYTEYGTPIFGEWKYLE